MDSPFLIIIYIKMQKILDSKYVEHQPFSNTWNPTRGGKIIFKLGVPPGFSVHAGMYLNTRLKLQIFKNTTYRGAQVGGNAWYTYNSRFTGVVPDGEDANQTQIRIGECAGLAFQQAISEIKVKINKKGVQRYRNRDFLREYLQNIVGNNIEEINDGYKWYKEGSSPTKMESMVHLNWYQNNVDLVNAQLANLRGTVSALRDNINNLATVAFTAAGMGNAPNAPAVSVAINQQGSVTRPLDQVIGDKEWRDNFRAVSSKLDWNDTDLNADGNDQSQSRAPFLSQNPAAGYA